jgi:hypothetical protein
MSLVALVAALEEEKEQNKRKKHEVEKKNSLFSFACHYYTAHGCESFCSAVVSTIAIRCCQSCCPSVPFRFEAKLVGSSTFDSTFTYQKEVDNTSFVDLLLSKGILDNHSFHKVSHSFLKVVLSERTSITIGVAIVNNIELIIQVGGYTPKVILLDAGAQLMILEVQFTQKMGMLDSKLRKSMWQICTISGSAEEVLGESLDLITLNFNECTIQELYLQVRCLFTNATNYDVLNWQEAMFPLGFTIDNWFKHTYY